MAIKDKQVKVENAKVEEVKPEKKEKVEKPEKKEKVNNGPTITRVQAAAIAVKEIKGETTVKGLIEATDKIYTKAGGGANEKESRWAVRMALPVALTFELIQVDGDTVKRV